MNDVINLGAIEPAPGCDTVCQKGTAGRSAPAMPAGFRTRPALATPDVQVHFLIFSTDTAGAALHSFPGFIDLGVSIAAGEPRLRAHQIADPTQAAGNPAALSLEPPTATRWSPE